MRDWSSKNTRETDEIEAALDAGDAAAIVEEIGDFLRAVSKPIRKMPSAG